LRSRWLTGSDFEDSEVRKQNFLVRLPDDVLVVSTSEFLYGLESLRLLPDASELLRRATAIRGNEILNRSLGGTSATEGESWPLGMRPTTS
jgi:hypothetical protein